MADAAVTPGSVLPVAGQGSVINKFLAGEAHNAGDCLYQTNAANGYWFKASSANALSAGAQAGLAFSLSGAAGAGQQINLFQGGQIVLGTASLVAGGQYGVSINSGKIGSMKDRLTGEFGSYVGFALNSTTLRLGPPVPTSVALTTNA